jgi:protein ImuA
MIRKQAIVQATHPPSSERPPGLIALRRQIALLEKLPQAGLEGGAARSLTWGVAAIDQHLPGRGLILGALHEFAGEGQDLEEGTLPAAAIARLIGRLHAQGNIGSVLWISRQRDLYARALPHQGLDPDRLLHLQIRRNSDALWAIEEALRCASLSAVVGEVAALDLTQSRRLQLAAEKSGVPALLIRRSARAQDLKSLNRQPIAAVTRWRISPAASFGTPAAPHPILPGAPRWHLDLWRCRGGRPANWFIEEHDDGWREAAFPQPVPAPLGERLLAPPAAADDIGHKRATG